MRTTAPTERASGRLAQQLQRLILDLGDDAAQPVADLRVDDRDERLGLGRVGLAAQADGRRVAACGLVVDPGAFGQAGGDGLRAGRRGTHEERLVVLGDDDVGQSAGLDVDDGLVLHRRLLQGVQQREAGDLDLHRAQPGELERLREAVDAVAADGGHENAFVALDRAGRACAAVVQDDVVEGHRQEVLGQVAPGRVQLGALQAGGQVDHADDQPRMREADAHVARQLVCGEEGAQLGGERLGVRHLSVGHDADGKRS